MWNSRIARRFVAFLLLNCLTACGERKALAARLPADSARADSIARARQDSINRTLPGYVIDSLLPVDEELRRFRAAIGGEPVPAFVAGSPSREALAKRF